MKESLRVEIASRQAAENRLKLLLQATSEGITILENGRHIDANKRYAEMLGYDPKELSDISVLDVAAPEYRETVMKRISAGYDKPYEVDCLKKDGTVIRVEVYGHSIEYEGRKLRLSALRDISGRKSLEDRLEFVSASRIAKIARPGLTGVIERPRLYRLFDEGRKRPVIWIASQAGAGKTTAAADYLQRRGFNYMWYKVDERDADLSTFFYYMGMAATKSLHLGKNPLPLLASEYLQGINTFTLRFFEKLYGKMPPPFIIVFDNYQDVAKDALFHEIMNTGLSVIPDGINVILISRHAPPPVFNRLIANNAMSLISWEDMRLTLDETVEIVSIRTKTVLDDKTIGLIHEKTDRWAAGLILFLEKAGKEDISSPDNSKVAGDPLPVGVSGPTLIGPGTYNDYFTAGIFDRLDGPTQEFLLKTALLPEITPDMADRLTGLKHTVSGFPGKTTSAGVLSALSDKNLFTLRLDTQRELYRYHPLFRDFLLSRGREFFTPEEFSQIRSTAASILEESGYFETAAELFIDGRLWQRLAGIILANAPSMAAQGRTSVVEGWLRHLPEELLSKSPRLLYWYGICRLPYDFSAARESFQKSYGLFKKSLADFGGADGGIDGAYLSWCGIVDTFMYELGNFPHLDPWIDEFYDLYSLYPAPESLELNVRVTTSILLALICRKPIRTRIMPWVERAGELVKKDLDMNLSLMLVSALLLYYLSVGKFDDATMLANEFRRDVPHSNVNNVSLIMWKTLDAMVYCNTGHFEDALKSVTDGLAIAEKTGVLYWNVFLFMHGAYSCILCGNLKGAEHYISKMNPALVVSRPLDLCQYHFIASWYGLIRGDIHDAAGHLQISLKLAETAGRPYPLALNHISSAILLFKTGHRSEALEQIGKAGEIAERMESSLLEFKILMARTLICFEKGEEKEGSPCDDCVKMLRRLMELGTKIGPVCFSGFGREDAALIYARAMHYGIEPQYATDCIRKFNLNPPYDDTITAQWPYPVKIRALGRFDLFKDGHPLEFAKKAQKKPLDMLKALIALGGEGVSEEQISDVLWADSDGDAAHLSFKFTLHQLRKLLGSDKSVILLEGLLSLNADHCQTDVREFLNLSEKADILFKKSTKIPDENIGNLIGGGLDEFILTAESAIYAYRGNFLAGEAEKPWALPLREKLRSKFVRLIVRMGSLYEKSGRTEEAIACYKRALEVDDLKEEFYIKLIRCYKGLGLECDAKAVYNRYKSLFKTAYGVEPSTNFDALGPKKP